MNRLRLLASAVLSLILASAAWAAEASTIVLSNENGLIDRLVAAGYSSSSLYQVLVALQPKSGGVVADSFMAKLKACPAGCDVHTAALWNFTDISNNPIGVGSDGNLIVAPIYGRDHRGKTGYATHSEDGVLYTYATSAQYYIDAGARTRGGVTTYYKATAVIWNAVPAITLAGIGNAANYVSGKVAPGEIVVVYGSNLGPSTLASITFANGVAATTLGNTRIYFHGVAAPMIYAVDGQLSCVVPYSVYGKTSTVVQVEYGGVKGNSLTVPVATAVPGIFSQNQTGTGAGAILNSPDYTLNTASSRVAAGGYVMVFGTGEGMTGTAVDGQLVPLAGPWPAPLLKPWTATVAGKTAAVVYAGSAPYNIAGLFQVNVQIPADLAPGTYNVVISAGGFSSQAGLTVAVK